MAEKKGIRVNALAKELGVESKAILHKLKEEGLSDAAPNHMSVISLGLAESVREWFAHVGGESGGGTAVETAPPVEATKTKTSRARTKKKAEAPADGEETVSTETAVTAEAPAPAQPAPVAAPQAPEAPVEQPPVLVEAPAAEPV
ncbi:MAG TPA: translation initiation factor IF-2 N-terminal domain-containing protein, partial [Tepidisphaeraceae bacterium]|nr:translation initiation factor IF-2 N-terminal domain-containing protein [Tepidisphaeraceae bacterium]